MTAVLTVSLAACWGDSEHESLRGTWELDAETREWVPRACVVLDFDPDREARFEIERRGEEYLVRLSDRRETTFHGRVRGGVFDGRQLLPTSQTGRVCGSAMAVHLRLDLRRQEPGTLRGTWGTPACVECPDRTFGAVRTGP